MDEDLHPGLCRSRQQLDRRVDAQMGVLGHRKSSADERGVDKSGSRQFLCPFRRVVQRVATKHLNEQEHDHRREQKGADVFEQPRALARDRGCAHGGGRLWSPLGHGNTSMPGAGAALPVILCM